MFMSRRGRVVDGGRRGCGGGSRGGEAIDQGDGYGRVGGLGIEKHGGKACSV